MTLYSIIRKLQKVLDISFSILFQSAINKREIDICGAMPDNESQKTWGDWYFCLSLKAAFERAGYKANIITKDNWYKRSSAKYVIVLRGLYEYKPIHIKGKKYLMWNISHPDDVSLSEYDQYDFVFFASPKMYDRLNKLIFPPSTVLLQCCDRHLICNESKGMPSTLLFVGNSRGVFRSILRDLLPTSFDLKVYGGGWNNYPVRDYVVKELLDHDQLGQAYHNAKIVLNDHWDDMRINGIVSNRIFDVLASGGFVISDDMAEIHTLFNDNVVTYTTREDLNSKIEYYLSHEDERKSIAERGRALVLSGHTFDDRVSDIIKILKTLD